MFDKKIVIKGAREHNLQNVNLTLPKEKLIVFTGVSGSGKSSLAFDTIYAEGQRRYVESLSSYARQFLGIMSKPQVDSIEGLSPSISIDQKTVSRNPRSTVGTTTEIYDYLRLLFAKIGEPFCSVCGEPIKKLSVDEIVIQVLAKLTHLKNASKPITFSIVSPVVINRKGEFEGLFKNLMAKGYIDMIVDGQALKTTDNISLIKTNKHDIDVKIEFFSVQSKQLKDEQFLNSLKSRLFNAIEQSLVLADGLVKIVLEKETQVLSQNFACPNGHNTLTELEPRIFSFNSPLGACSECKGLGRILTIDPKRVLNYKLSINEGGILPFNRILHQDTWFSRLLQTFFDSNNIDLRTPIGQLTSEERDLILWGSNRQYRVYGRNRFGRETAIVETFSGVVGELDKRYRQSESEYASGEIEKYMTELTCSTCEGRRLKEEVLSVRIGDFNIYELSQLSIVDLITFLKSHIQKLSDFNQELASGIFKEILSRLNFLTDVGLSYLTLNRSSQSLSGGESQRIRLASQIGSGLSGVIYVLDEPSIGLHPTDVSALLKSLCNLRDLGNTIIVVEHDIETIRKADFIVDFGPKAGKHGGHIVFSGSPNKLLSAKTLTATYLNRKIRVPDSKVNLSPQGSIVISGCKLHNLKKIKVSFPLGQFICITGVSGSGKSSLVVDTLYPALRYYISGQTGEFDFFDSLQGSQYLNRVYVVDQGSIGKTPRSNPATYIGLFDEVREIFAQTEDARLRGYKKGRFSFNVKGGRCEKCLGAGTLKVEMQFLPDVYIDCDVCSGKRYNSETLEVKYKEKNIYEVLKMTVEEAITFFASHRRIIYKLQTLNDVGLGYVELGQPAPSLSGGEAQRIKLASELSRQQTGRTCYILDEPTTGLHMYDTEKLITILRQLADQGNTVIVIEHNIQIIAQADHIIDMGPAGGDNGGHIVYEGDILGLISQKHSLTGQFIKQSLK